MNESHIFTNALKFASPTERAAYLDQACAGNQELRAAVEALLRAQANDPDFLEQPPGSLEDTAAVPVSAGADPQEPSSAEQPGVVFAGRYKLIEQIGEGGMGTVWMTQQTEPVKRLVALKVIKPGMDSKQVLARFEAERQALALMDHPNIATVLDAGATLDGRPFFVMELVKGVPITRFCDENHLTPRQRLELFVPVCQAIQHAHQKGVIHRDIKPSNILVARYDDRPVPKVIDFGIAKAAGQPLTERTLHTSFGAVVGTIEYMSPEQASFNQLDVDTRSDVYALGVVLYELLTGSPPFGGKELERAGVLEMLRMIREQEPSKPSTKLSTAEGLPALAANRGTEPAKLARLVRGELDWIVMKALEKDRNRRYETANGLARDLQRYLTDEPVQACPPSTAYRLRKFVRRNRGPVLASAALALLLVAGITAVAVVKAQADRDRAAVETDRATRQARTDAIVTAAAREARERVGEAWAVTDYPDRMQAATVAAEAAVRRGEEAAAGSASEAVLAELAAARRDVNDIARHTRLIVADFASHQKLTDDLHDPNVTAPFWDFAKRACADLREFGLDPTAGSPEEVARVIVGSRIRDTLLGILLAHHHHAQKDLWRDYWGGKGNLPADAPPLRDRLGRVIRAARIQSGGAYARWQELLDRKDVPGLVAFAASPDALSFRSSVVNDLGRDLTDAGQHQAAQEFLRAAVDRYPHDLWLHLDLALTCHRIDGPESAEALQHVAVACALRPESAMLHLSLGEIYAGLQAYDRAIAQYRKAATLSPVYADLVPYWIGMAQVKKKDWTNAISSLREAARLLAKRTRHRFVPAAHAYLGVALAGAGRPAEGLREVLAALRQNPAWAEDPRNELRYAAACCAMNCADGKGMDAPPPAERPAYRKQAFDLLTAELAALRKLGGTDRADAHWLIQEWFKDDYWATVRDPKAREQLPPEERDAWNKLWADVRDLRDRTAPPDIAPPPRPVKR